MKITCQACQAKYTIADDKVAGKVVKIRCKKCGASIVVNGSESQAPSSSLSSHGPGAALEEVKPTDKDAWTVNVADGDQRTMTEAEIVENYRAGVINDDSFCWREGMADWLSLQEIAPLHAACQKMRSGAPGARAGGALPPVVADPTVGSAAAAGARLPPRPSDRAPARDGNGNGAGALAGTAPAATVAARRAGGRGATADLFSGAARAGGDDEVMTSAPAGVPEPHQDGQKAIGARNENSVLFALGEKGEAPPPQTMTASNEASGLIDIRQLSAQMHSAAEKKEKNVRVDDIMNLGASAGLSPNLGAPLLSAPSLEHYSQPPPSLIGSMGGVVEAKNKALVFLSLGAGTFFLVAAIGIAVLLVRGKDSTSAEGEKTAASASASAKGAASTAPAASEAPQPSAATEAPSATATESASAGPAPAKEAKETATKETPYTAPKEPKVMAPAPAKEAAPPTAAPAAEFNMGEARSRLAAVAASAQTCKRGDTAGSGRVEIVFAPSGAVQSANLMPGSPFDGTPTGKCVEARFRGARVPAFTGSPFTVTKSFSIN
jgi:predicted Zn finger-like uncharacterized protein